MSDVRAKSGVPVLADFTGLPLTGTTAPPLVVNTLTGDIYSWKTGDIIVKAGADGTVTSVDVSGGTTGLTTSGGPVTSSGTITLAGTLAVANGGTGNAGTLSTFTPVLTFGTPGDLAVTYTRQIGRYLQIGKLVFCEMHILTSAFTYTTASGNCTITGFPATSVNVAGLGQPSAAMTFGGITKVGYTSMALQLNANSTIATIRASGSAVAVSTVTATDMPSGGTVELRLNFFYEAA